MSRQHCHVQRCQLGHRDLWLEGIPPMQVDRPQSRLLLQKPHQQQTCFGRPMFPASAARTIAFLPRSQSDMLRRCLSALKLRPWKQSAQIHSDQAHFATRCSEAATLYDAAGCTQRYWSAQMTWSKFHTNHQVPKLEIHLDDSGQTERSHEQLVPHLDQQ